jgi:hypothetical protein
MNPRTCSACGSRPERYDGTYYDPPLCTVCYRLELGMPQADAAPPRAPSLRIVETAPSERTRELRELGVDAKTVRVVPSRDALAYAADIARRVAAEYLTKGNEIGWKLNASGALAVADALEADRRDLPETKPEREAREAREELEQLGEQILANAEALPADNDRRMRDGAIEFVRAALDYLRAVRDGGAR